MIGIFDSGIGGLTVVRAIKKRLPRHDIIYLGDTARTPYGNKTPETVVKYALENTDFLIEKGARIIVMACNTASSVAFDAVKKNFDAPIFEVISPAVASALSRSKIKTAPKKTAQKKTAAPPFIGVIGTRATIESGVYERKIKEIQPDAHVFSNACPLLVPLVEEGWLNRPETRMIVKKYLHPLKTRQIHTLILGCTHYPVLKDLIQQKIGPRVAIVDSPGSSASAIADYLNACPDMDSELEKNGALELYASDLTPQFEKTAKIILKQTPLFQRA